MTGALAGWLVMLALAVLALVLAWRHNRRPVPPPADDAWPVCPVCGCWLERTDFAHGRTVYWCAAHGSPND